MNDFIVWWWLSFVPNWLPWVLVAIVAVYAIGIIDNHIRRYRP